MSTAERVWISEAAERRLRTELDELRALLDRAPLEDEQEDRLAVQRARQARVHHIIDLLSRAAVGEDPDDDGVAEPGMVLTVRYDDTGELETFLFGVRGAEYGDLEIYSPQSPLGSALLGAQTGEQRTFRTPAGGIVPITLLQATPHSLHRSGAA